MGWGQQSGTPLAKTKTAQADRLDRLAQPGWPWERPCPVTGMTDLTDARNTSQL